MLSRAMVFHSEMIAPGSITTTSMPNGASSRRNGR